ncbi:F-box/kelch-repeat protein At3g23880-like [Corylus avellana]|uniref:F-box/kelch-repeat protein At3g23880-like n=1 Tax=Corylus avellana TaxID=13451 RepID=UPI00286D1278|nr:F-box/kelch-repeat protein At3g23880-like [Corylus avellana]
MAKRQRNPMLMSNELSEDLVTQILLWLPVVSLLRHKCVCKSWYALITNQYFVRKHVLHNKNNDSKKNILLLPKTTTLDYVVSMLSYETLQVSQVSPTQPVYPPYFGIINTINVLGSCNGLICLLDIYSVLLVIWNPATKKTKFVPESNPCSRYGADIDAIGFGFDAKTNDYKIIMLVSFSHPPYEEEVVIYQKEIYSLSADSWRKVDGPRYTDLHGYEGPMTYINGMASWEASGDDWVGLLSFDMSDEVFLITPLPDDVIGNPSSHICKNFFVMNESIAMATSMWTNSMREKWLDVCFDIWLLVEVGVKNSWTKLFTIGPFSGISRPLGLLKNETMLLEKYNNQLVLYDPSTEKMTNIQIHENTVSEHLVTYMETLVSVKGGNEFVDINA